MDALGDLQAALDGRYEVLRELGRGGMAVVYLARDLKHDREVAIKELRPEMATAVGAERFVREIQTAARLSHPNILPLHDSIAAGAVRAYVMPYVQGETLRQRLERERQLGIGEAIDIARQVAAGLDYAHAHGVVHRDIKPENILLTGDQAMIADFGLARALFTAGSVTSTQSGIAVGTPAYMSPEQAAADRSVDGRTDVYSLGCLVFEMIAGVPPFRGATAGALMKAHATRTPPSLCAERESCPEQLDAAVRKALAKLPADRFHSAGEFVRALDGPRLTPLTTPVIGSRIAWLPWATGVAIVVVLAVVTPAVTERIALARAPIDSNRVVMLPVSGTGGHQVTPVVARQRLTSAMMEWRDLHVVEPPSGTTEVVAVTQGSQIARRAGASRFLAATAVAMGDSVELRATLYDARGDPVRQQAVRVADDIRGGAERYRALVANLLRTSDGEDDGDDARPGTTRVAAWRAFTRGDSLRRSWALPEAEKAFQRAVSLDPGFARAHLWLAQVLHWQRPSESKVWGDEAGKAKASAAALSESDSLLIAGLADLSANRHPEACTAYRRLHALMPRSDIPWYGISFCLGFDPVVVQSAQSPSGWRFRGSTYSGVRALDSALAHATGVPSFAFKWYAGLLITEPSRVRAGVGVPGHQTFYAYPSLQSDTVVFTPYAASEFRGAHVRGVNGSDVIRQNIAHLDGVYREWVRRTPRSPNAWDALSSVQELQGDSASIVSVRRARSLSDSGQLRLFVREVRLLVKQQRIAAARALADSLLRASPHPTGTVAQQLSGVAALFGDVSRASQLLAASARENPAEVFESRYPAPAPVIEAASRLLAWTASGACNSSLRQDILAMRQLLVQYAPLGEQDELQRAVLTRSVSLAVPCLGPSATLGLESGDRLVRMQQQLAAGRVSGLRAMFDTLREERAGMRPGDVAIDHLYQEAWLLAAMGDSVSAARYLDLPLTALWTLSTHFMDDVPSASALGRAFALRAELAAAAGDHSMARRRASDVIALWGPSPDMHAVIDRMRVLGGQ